MISGLLLKVTFPKSKCVKLFDRMVGGAPFKFVLTAIVITESNPDVEAKR